MSALLLQGVACSYYTTASDDVDASVASSSGSDGGQASSSSGDAMVSSSSSSGTQSGSSGSSSSASTSSSSTGGVSLTEFEQSILDGFNAARLTANPTPDPALPVLYWDYEAATECANHTLTCSGAFTPEGMVSGTGSTPMTAGQIVAYLTSAKDAYTYNINTCTGDIAVCELYKMVVQRSVVRVACSVSSCSGSTDSWACRFAPVGSLGVEPY